MPSLRKRVSSYFRQLSFHNEPRYKKNNINENSFVTKYLQGHITLREGPPIIYGKSPTDLPNYDLAKYESGPDSVVGCYSGPNGGLTTVKRTEKHLSIPDADIDFIDTHDEEIAPTQPIPKKSPNRIDGQPIDNTTMVIKVAGHEYCVTNRSKRHSKSLSLGSISEFNIEIEKTKIEKSFYCDNNKDENLNEIKCSKNGDTESNDCDKSCIEEKLDLKASVKEEQTNVQRNIKKPEEKRRERVVLSSTNKSYSLSKSKSDGNPFHNKKRGKIIKIERPNTSNTETEASNNIPSIAINDSSLPPEWNRKSSYFYGLSDSLYDRNQVTKNKNGDPIADCFGIISRNDSAILAVADGVNWGEKASIAAKSAIHGCLHYLNKTIFNDTKPFENLTKKTDETTTSNLNPNHNLNLIGNTREVFVCLLRAFNCAHDLILENEGMLTTLTVAVVLPLKQKSARSTENGAGDRRDSGGTRYVCCVCNVGDTLAYVYSQKFGVRELTKGSHDITSNRDMRDALGALGPVDGINPELSNLTLSVTTLNKGDIVMVASDGLTDNFDPNVCRFTVNSTLDLNNKQSKRPSTSKPARATSQQREVEVTASKPMTEVTQKPPVKPPRRSKARGSMRSEHPNVSSNEVKNVPKQRQNSSERVKSATLDREVKTKSDECSSKEKSEVQYDNPLVAEFMRENSVEKTVYEQKKPVVLENKASSLRKQAATQLRQEPLTSKPVNKTLQVTKSHTETVGYKFLKSKTSLDLRSTHVKNQILRNEDGIPYVTPIQRYELQLLLIEDILKNGISGNDSQCSNAKTLCENLVSFTMSITAAKRHTLEELDLYFDNRNGLLVEVTNQEKKIRRKKALEKVQSLPGKLDHVTVVAFNVGNVMY